MWPGACLEIHMDAKYCKKSGIRKRICVQKYGGISSQCIFWFFHVFCLKEVFGVKEVFGEKG